jgi:ABC-2 type transport system permease protein
MRRVLVDTATLFRREMLRYRRDRAYWVGQLAFPLAFVAFIGFGLDRVVELPTGIDYVAHIASGALALVVASAGVGGGFTLIEDRQSGFLRALLVAPVSRTSLVLGKITARVVASLVLALVMIGMLAPFTSLRLPHPAVFVLAIAGLTTAFVALGIVLAAALRSLESFRLLSAFATIPIYLLSGIFYPLATLPMVTRALATANPFTYGVDLLRYALLDVHEVPVAFSAALLAVLMVGSTLLAIGALDRWTRD